MSRSIRVAPRVLVIWMWIKQTHVDIDTVTNNLKDALL